MIWIELTADCGQTLVGPFVDAAVAEQWTRRHAATYPAASANYRTVTDAEKAASDLEIYPPDAYAVDASKDH